MGETRTKTDDRVSLAYYGSLLRRYLMPLRLKVSLLAILLLGDTALRLVNPQIVRRFIDTAHSEGSSTALATMAAVFIVVVFSTQIVAGAATYLSQDLGWSATNGLRIDLLRHCVSLDQQFYQLHPPGELIARIDGDVFLLSNFLSAFVMRVLGNLLLLTGIITLIVLEEWRIGVVLAVYTAGALWMLRRTQGVVVPSFTAYRRTVAALSGFWEEVLTGREDIRSSGAEAHILGEQDRLLGALRHDGRLAMVMGRVAQSVLEGLTAVGTALVFALGAYLLEAGTITIGTVFLIFYYTIMLTSNLGDLTAQLNDVQGAAAGIARIRELLNATSSIVDGPGAAPPPGPPAVTFREVSFGYDAATPCLRDLTFELQAGHVLGVLGRTGSGKTTLARLLFRFYDPDRGTILLSGVHAREMQLSTLRRRIGMVTQDVQVFEATVRDNLTFFGRQIPDERLLGALADLGLIAWYGGLPAGLDTPITADRLSAGEAQLLALTRVFLAEPDLVVLDEAAARLDPATERLLDMAIGRLLQGRTGIIIAHRPSSVQRADEILILEDGRIIEHGTRTALAADPASGFARLCRAGLTEGSA